MNMKPLQPPTQDVAARILSEVRFEERLIGYRLRKRMGPFPVSLYSFEEVVRFLCEEIPQLDFGSLKEWVRGTIGDEDLARGIEEITQTDLGDQEKALHIRNQMALRLAQCKRLVALAIPRSP